MNELKKLTKGTLVYLFGTIGSKLVSFLLLPLYTKYLPPEAYGIYDVNITYATLFSSFFFLDIWTGIMRFFFERKQEQDKQQVVYCGAAIFAGSTLLYTGSMLLFGAWIGIEYLPGVILYGFCLCLQNLYGYLARAYGWNFYFALSGIVSTLCNALLNVGLLMLARMDYSALYVSFGAGILVQCVMLEGKVHLFPGFRRDYLERGTIRELLRFSLPLCVNSLCYWLLTGYNKVVINQRLSDADNGYYAIGTKFAGILLIVTSCFTMAWQELAYGKYEKSEENGRFYTRAVNLYLAVLFLGYGILIPAIYLCFPLLVDGQYSQALALVPLSMLAAFGGILYTFLGNIITTFKRNDGIFLSTLCACGVNMVVLHLGIGRLVVHAANLALFLGYGASDILRVWIIRREISFRVDGRLLLGGCVLAGITIWNFFFGGWMGNGIQVLIGVGVGVGAAVFLLLPYVRGKKL
ncbi:MAG: lipopolysaccharide biosynthesis protein [Lachnospiraceae bacterium]|jgi:O-antigen/teichoic acid export membrane protein|nr:lipopolysaccharide biosynthesis protein [Lachnospiraceae bacterium]